MPLNGQSKAGKPGARLVPMANGVVATLRGAISLDNIHDWIDKVGRMGHTNWVILDLREMRGTDGGVWSTIEMGMKKLVKKGAKRLLIVVNHPDVVKLVNSATKRAGVNHMAEYFDASKKPFDQTRVVTYLRENWKR